MYDAGFGGGMASSQTVLHHRILRTRILLDTARILVQSGLVNSAGINLMFASIDAISGAEESN